jgi:hypothetical protein
VRHVFRDMRRKRVATRPLHMQSQLTSEVPEIRPLMGT